MPVFSFISIHPSLYLCSFRLQVSSSAVGDPASYETGKELTGLHYFRLRSMGDYPVFPCLGAELNYFLGLIRTGEFSSGGGA